MTHRTSAWTALPGLVVRDHTFELPLNHAVPEGESVEVYGREVVQPSKRDAKLPWLVFLQGGRVASRRAPWAATAGSSAR